MKRNGSRRIKTKKIGLWRNTEKSLHVMKEAPGAICYRNVIRQREGILFFTQKWEQSN